MKRLALSLVVLLCLSMSQANADVLYSFDNLTSGAVLSGQVDATAGVTWVALANAGLAYNVSVESGGDLYLTATTGKQEQLISTMTDPNTQTSCLNLSSSDKEFEISFIAHMNVQVGQLVGIWVDGVYDLNNTMLTDNQEILCQFGVSSGKWRMRGPNGTPSVNTLNTDLPAAGTVKEYKVVLDIDLEVLSGDGVMSLSFGDLDTGELFRPVGYQNIAMGLLSKDAKFSNPANYTGWWIRGQQSGTPIDTMTLDDLRITIPEPATMSLLVLGGLACLRRRR